MHDVLPSYWKSWSSNPLMILVLTYDISFKVICDFQGQSYIKHAISALLLPETQYVLPSYGKAWSRNPLTLLVLTYDICSRSSVTLRIKCIQIMLYLKLIWKIEGQTVRIHSLYSNIMLLAVLIATVSKNCN